MSDKITTPIKNLGGRPATVATGADKGSRVTTYVRASDHDRLIRIARDRNTSVASVVRQLLILRLPPTDTK